MALDRLGSNAIADLSISAADIAAGTITTAQIADGAVTLPKTSGVGGRKNIIINGDMKVDQHNTVVTAGSNATTNNQYVADRFAMFFQNGSGPARLNTSNATITDHPLGFANAAKVVVQTADDGSDTTNVYAAITYRGNELMDTEHLMYGTATAKPVALSFWVKSGVTGTYIAQIRGLTSGTDRSKYHATYTVDTADTWEKKTISVPAPGASIVFNNTIKEFDILWHLHSTSDRIDTTVNQWFTDTTNVQNVRCGTGQVSFISTLNAEFYLTGVQLEVGTAASDFEHLHYTEQLRNCQRYFISTNPNALRDAATNQSCYVMGAGYNSKARFNHSFAPMRTVPAGTVVDASGSGDVRIYNSSSGSAYSGSWTFENTLVMASYYTSNLSSVNGKGLMAQMGDEHDNFSLYLELDAEL